MNVVLWIVAALLATAFAVAGTMKVVLAKPALAARGLGWVTPWPAVAVKAIGVLELLAAVGLVVPPLLGIVPWLSPAAALGIVVLMTGAAILHIRRGEPQLMGVNALFVLLAAAVVCGRFGFAPF